MAVPGFQEFMLPLLRLAGDGSEQTLGEAAQRVAEGLRLTAEDLAELLPSGKQTRFKNRIGWAATYLRKTKLLEATRHGRFRITDRGHAVLKDPPQRIDLEYLKRFPEYGEFTHKPAAEGEPVENGGSVDAGAAETTPEEALEESYRILRHKLAEELLETIKSSSPAFFEKLVVDLLVAMGYGGSRSDAGQAVGGSGDGGIDGIIKEDRLGLDAIYLQAKRWESSVDRPTVQAFAGSLEGHRARKGVLISTSQFTKGAREYVERIEKKIVLIDGTLLAQLMIDHGVGVTDVSAYVVKKLDQDYFDE